MPALAVCCLPLNWKLDYCQGYIWGYFFIYKLYMFIYISILCLFLGRAPGTITSGGPSRTQFDQSTLTPLILLLMHIYSATLRCMPTSAGYDHKLPTSNPRANHE